MLLKMTKNPTIADDLTIEVFGKAFCSLKSYAPVRPFSSWLFSIASNNGIDFIRRKKETLYIDDITVMDGDDEYDYQLPSDIGNPEEEFEREQRKQVLRTVVGQLRPKYRQMIELRYFEELSYDEISKRLNMPPGTVRINLFRAHEVLQSIMRQKKDII